MQYVRDLNLAAFLNNIASSIFMCYFEARQDSLVNTIQTFYENFSSVTEISKTW